MTNGKPGAPKGNTNAKGKKGGTAPKGNKYAVGNGAPKGNLNALKNAEYYNPEKHEYKDFLKKYVPMATYNIVKDTTEAGIGLLDILWMSIQLQFAAVLRSQKIMHVKNKNEMIKELKKTKVQNDVVGIEGNEKTLEIYREEEYEFQFSWDRQNTFMQAQSKSYDTLVKLIKQYDDMLHNNWDMASDEQKLRIEKLKAEIMRINQDDSNEVSESDGFIEALNNSSKEDWSDEED